MSETKPPKSAARKAVETKGKIELSRAAKMAAWTKANGKADAENPFSKENCSSKLPGTPSFGR
jgi:hypothetical protein